MKQITLEQLAIFLPYGLTGISKEKNRLDTLLGVYGTGGHSLTMCCRVNNHNTVDYGCDLDDFKPALKPLSNYADINGQAMIELNCDLSDQIEISNYASWGLSDSRSLRMGLVQIMAKNHIDIFDWITDGLAVNHNEIK